MEKELGENNSECVQHMTVIGYKILNSNHTGYTGFQYRIGQWYKSQIGESGFHFCRQAPFCMDYVPYITSINPLYTRVECRGSIEDDKSGKSVCSEIKIEKVLSLREWNEICTGQFITPLGEKRFYENGKLHRKDGPAIEYPNGGQEWYQYNLLHREDGPAIIFGNRKEWYINGLLCREGGLDLQSSHHNSCSIKYPDCNEKGMANTSPDMKARNNDTFWE